MAQSIFGDERSLFEYIEKRMLESFRHYVRVEMRYSVARMGRDFWATLRFPRGNQIAVATSITDESLRLYGASVTEHILEDTSTRMMHRLMAHTETWIRIAKDELTFAEIIGINDIEQRMVALKRYGVEKILHDAKAQLIEKSMRGNELYLIPSNTGLFSVDAYYLKYQCPSTGRLYISGVPPQMGETKSADACMAWKHGLSTEAYKLLNAEA